MPSFTIPKDTPIKITYGDGEYTESMPSPTYVSWEDNRKQRTMKLKQPSIPTYDLAILDDMIDSGQIKQSVVQSYYNGVNYLDTLNCVPQPCKPAKGVSNNKEHNMSNNIYATAASVNSTVPTDQKQRDYTLGRLQELKNEKTRELRKTFGLDDDEAPHSFEELMARIKDGKFTFPKDHETEYNGPVDVMYMIRWRDPSVKSDTTGFEAAKEKMNETYTTARDTVVLSAADQGLKIIEDFKSATFH